MKMKTKTIITFIMIALIALSMCSPVFASNIKDLIDKYADDGDIGTNLQYSWDGAGTMTISGSGNMAEIAQNQSFRKYLSCEHLIIEEGVTSISKDAFNGFSYLNKVQLPSSLKEIGDNAFSFCSALTKITIPENVKQIGDMAFYCCYELNDIVIPESVEYIGRGAFQSCDKLSDITINLGAEIKFGNYVFNDTAFYKDQSNWDNDVLYLSNNIVAANDNSISGECKIKDGTVSIAGWVFYGAKKLTKVEIPQSVKYIGDSSFSYCTELEITVPDSVVDIGVAAFNKVKVIRCSEGSYAYKYATEENINVEVIKPTEATGSGNGNTTIIILIAVAAVIIIAIIAVIIVKKKKKAE